MLQTIPGFRDADRSRDTQLIELTAKRWKAFTVIAAALSLLGLLFISWQLWAGIYRPLLETGLRPGAMPEGVLDASFFGPAGIVGMVVLGAGLAVAFYARFMAWWHHG